MVFKIVVCLAAFLSAASAQNFSAIRDFAFPYDLKTPYPFRTLSPINVDSSKTRLVFLPTPLKLNIGLFEPHVITNTGNEVIVTPRPPVVTSITGGVLGEGRYIFHDLIYHWTGDYRSDSGASVDGVGSPLTISARFQNIQYPDVNMAKTMRDGFAVININVNVAGQAPNPLFFQFENVLKSIIPAGTSTTTLTTLPVFIWFNQFSVDHYYAYPGAYINGGNNYNEQFDSATIIQFPRELSPYISIPQFENFLRLLNPTGTPVTNILSTHSRLERPVVEAIGQIQKIPPIA